MKKVLLVLGVAFVLVSQPCYAQFVGQGSGVAPTTVGAIVASPVDNQWVTLKGKITKQISKDKYNFTDGTGEIIVEIEAKYFPPNRPVTPDTTIEIAGKVDTGIMKKVKIEVKNLVISDTDDKQQKSGFSPN